MKYSRVVPPKLYKRSTMSLPTERKPMHPLLKKFCIACFSFSALLFIIVTIATINSPSPKVVKEVKIIDKMYGEKPEASAWDGSYRPVTKYLEKIAYDSNSIKIKECTNVIRHASKGWQVRCNYMGKNAFGAILQNSTVFFIQHGQVTSTSI